MVVLGARAMVGLRVGRSAGKGGGGGCGLCLRRPESHCEAWEKWEDLLLFLLALKDVGDTLVSIGFNFNVTLIQWVLN